MDFWGAGSAQTRKLAPVWLGGRWQWVQHARQGDGLQPCLALPAGGECVYRHLFARGKVSGDPSQALSPFYIKFFTSIYEKDGVLFLFPVVEIIVCSWVFEAYVAPNFNLKGF